MQVLRSTQECRLTGHSKPALQKSLVHAQLLRHLSGLQVRRGAQSCRLPTLAVAMTRCCVQRLELFSYCNLKLALAAATQSCQRLRALCLDHCSINQASWFALQRLGPRLQVCCARDHLAWSAASC